MGTQLQFAGCQKPFRGRHLAHLMPIPLLRFLEVAGYMNHALDHLQISAPSGAYDRCYWPQAARIICTKAGSALSTVGAGPVIFT